jgi:hypothetical protein
MKKIIIVIEYIVAFLIILDCNTVYYSLLSRQLNTANVFFTILLTIICLVQYKQNYINLNKSAIFLGLYYIYALVLLLFSVDDEHFESYIVRFLVVVPMLSIYFASVNRDGMNYFSLLYKFSGIMILLALVSLVMWVAVSCMGKIQQTGYIPYTWGEIHRDYAMFIPHYFYIYFETQYIDILRHVGDIYRNTGIFNEGPMYNACLCISLLIELFLRDRINKFRITIITITILTIFSAIGYIVLLLAFTCFLFSRKMQKIISLFMIALSVYAFVEIVLPQKMETFSYEERTEHVNNGIEIWKSSPIFGRGYATSALTVSSNGIWKILGEGGIYFFLLYVITLLLIPYYYYRIKRISRGTLFVFLTIFILLYPTIVQYRYIILMFIALSFSFTLSRRIQTKSNLIIKYIL